MGMEDVLRIDKFWISVMCLSFLWQEMPLIHCIFVFYMMMRRFIAIREYVSLHVDLNPS